MWRKPYTLCPWSYSCARYPAHPWASFLRGRCKQRSNLLPADLSSASLTCCLYRFIRMMNLTQQALFNMVYNSFAVRWLPGCHANDLGYTLFTCSCRVVSGPTGLRHSAGRITFRTRYAYRCGTVVANNYAQWLLPVLLLRSQWRHLATVPLYLLAWQWPLIPPECHRYSATTPLHR
jgi:hypothetical protein